VESGKYGQEWQDKSSKGPHSSMHIPKGDPLTVRDLTSLTPHVARIIYFHVIKANINKA
jgi:hypothetical protein